MPLNISEAPLVPFAPVAPGSVASAARALGRQWRIANPDASAVACHRRLEAFRLAWGEAQLSFFKDGMRAADKPEKKSRR